MVGEIERTRPIPCPVHLPVSLSLSLSFRPLLTSPILSTCVPSCCCWSCSCWCSCWCSSCCCCCCSSAMAAPCSLLHARLLRIHPKSPAISPNESAHRRAPHPRIGSQRAPLSTPAFPRPNRPKSRPDSPPSGPTSNRTKAPTKSRVKVNHVTNSGAHLFFSSVSFGRVVLR